MSKFFGYLCFGFITTVFVDTMYNDCVNSKTVFLDLVVSILAAFIVFRLTKIKRKNKRRSYAVTWWPVPGSGEEIKSFLVESTNGRAAMHKISEENNFDKRQLTAIRLS